MDHEECRRKKTGGKVSEGRKNGRGWVTSDTLTSDNLQVIGFFY